MKRRTPFLLLPFVMIGFFLLGAQNTGGPIGKLAYLHGGELWMKVLPSGASRQVSQGGALAPEWSPSGRWLAFRQKGKVIVMLATGDPVPATTVETNGEYSWSPTEDELAFQEPNGLSVVRFDSNGNEKKTVLNNTASNRVSGFAWSPDGKSLAVSVTISNPDGKADDRTSRILRVNSGGGQPQEVISAQQLRPDQPIADLLLAGWSSDGQHVLIWFDPDYSSSLAADGLELLSVPVGSGAVQRLSATLPYKDFVSVSKRNQDILVVGGGYRMSWTNKRLFLADPIDGTAKPLGDAQAVTITPSWSPDGNRIVYVSGPDVPQASGGQEAKDALAHRHIWIMNANGTQQHELTSDVSYRDEAPVWSKDGRYIVFTRMDQQSKVSVWTIALSGGGLQRIADDVSPPLDWFGYYGHLRWSDFVAWFPE